MMLNEEYSDSDAPNPYMRYCNQWRR